jgi:hypothetical protein
MHPVHNGLDINANPWMHRITTTKLYDWNAATSASYSTG